ncbi:PucR family transcriptional regulator [Mycobacterium colombiense]|uniref:PucR family transcriptional regulator n=1 Tax=Mycobacterium colombiense TaxID=339268 RepID=UPI001E403598|nr:PucR family transcriptional regulator [Mycobacterium colombiense]
MASRIVDRYQAEVPKVVPDESAVDEELASVEASLRLIAQCLATGDDPRRFDLAPATAAIARSGVQRGIPLLDLLRSVRLAQELTWQWLFDRITATATTADLARALALATNWLFAFCDDVLTKAEHKYEIEREAWMGGAAAARVAAIGDILTEREDDPQRASKRLRYDINRHHVGVRAWLVAEFDDTNAQTTLTDAMAQLARAASAESSMFHPVGAKDIAGWISRSQSFTTAELDIVRGCGKSALPDGVWIAVGEPGWGISGFRRTDTEAAHAHRVASLLGDRASVVTCYRYVAVAALASADGAHAVAFVKRILGPLAADDETTRRVAATLAVYLEENRSPARAAHRLNVHPNTVGYRVNQAEELLGRPIDANVLDLSVALELLPALRGLTHPGDAGL